MAFEGSSINGFSPQPYPWSAPAMPAQRKKDKNPFQQAEIIPVEAEIGVTAMAHAANQGIARKAIDTTERVWFLRSLTMADKRLDPILNRHETLEWVMNKLHLQPETRAVMNSNLSAYQRVWEQRVHDMQAYSGNNVLGIGRQTLKDIEGYRNNPFKAWKTAVSENFADVRANLKEGRLLNQLPEGAPKMGVGNYIKYGILGDHFRNIGKLFSGQGGAVAAGVSGINIGLILFGVFDAMRRTYEHGEQNHEGLLPKLGKTLLAGGKELFKSLVSFHVGSLIFVPIYGLVATPILGTALGLAGAVIAGMTTTRLLNKLIGESAPPAPPKEASQTPD